MSHHIPEELIALLAGRDLNSAETANAESHLSRCAACADLLEDYRQRGDSMAALRADECGPADYQSVRAAVLDRIGRRANRTVWLQASFQWSYAAAAILLALGLGLLWMRSTPPARVAEIPTPAQIPVLERIAATAEAPGPSRQVHAPRSITSAASKNRSVPARRTLLASSLPVADAGSAQAPPLIPAAVPDDIVIKLETADPNVIIIWLASPRGEER